MNQNGESNMTAAELAVWVRAGETGQLSRLIGLPPRKYRRVLGAMAEKVEAMA